MSTKDVSEFIKFFATHDRMGHLVGARLVSLDGNECVFEYITTPEHYNPGGILHGGALYTVMDSSQGAFVHFNLDPKFRAAVTGTATIKYLSAVRTGTIRIRTWFKGQEGRKIFVSSEAVDSAGAVVATLEEIWIAIEK